MTGAEQGNYTPLSLAFCPSSVYRRQHSLRSFYGVKLGFRSLPTAQQGRPPWAQSSSNVRAQSVSSAKGLRVPQPELRWEESRKIPFGYTTCLQVCFQVPRLISRSGGAGGSWAKQPALAWHFFSSCTSSGGW